jgi:hypothetical protein
MDVWSVNGSKDRLVPNRGSILVLSEIRRPVDPVS